MKKVEPHPHKDWEHLKKGVMPHSDGKTDEQRPTKKWEV